jgi:hypothetical protein
MHGAWGALTTLIKRQEAAKKEKIRQKHKTEKFRRQTRYQ